MFICLQSCDYHLLTKILSHWYTRDFTLLHSKKNIVTALICMTLMVLGFKLCKNIVKPQLNCKKKEEEKKQVVDYFEHREPPPDVCAVYR